MTGVDPDEERAIGQDIVISENIEDISEANEDCGRIKENLHVCSIGAELKGKFAE